MCTVITSNAQKLLLILLQIHVFLRSVHMQSLSTFLHFSENALQYMRVHVLFTS